MEDVKAEQSKLRMLQAQVVYNAESYCISLTVEDVEAVQNVWRIGYSDYDVF